MKRHQLQKFFALTILVAIPPLALADAISDARQSALDFGTNYKSSASSTITTQNKSIVPGYTTDSPEQTKYYNGGASIDTDAQAKVKSSSEGDLMTKGLPNRPQVKVSASDSFLSSSKAITENPDEVVAMLTGTYGECKPLTYTSTDSETRTCDEYEERSGGSCVVGQEITVEAQHKYQCDTERKFQDKSCDNTLSILCENNGQENCAVTGVKFISSSSNTQWSQSASAITVNLYGNWGWVGSQYDRNVNFQIDDLNEVIEFVLTDIQQYYSAVVYVNGSQVFTNTKFWVTDFDDRNTKSTSTNIDLKPYLKNGTNVVRFLLIMDSSSAVKFRVQQTCCSNPRDVWTEVCS